MMSVMIWTFADVITWSTIEHVGPCLPCQLVRVVVALQVVQPVAPKQGVRAVLTVQVIIAVAALYAVALRAAVQVVISGISAADLVVIVVPVDDVKSSIPAQEVGPVATIDRVEAIPSRVDVVCCP
jgi:hypothetical protein